MNANNNTAANTNNNNNGANVLTAKSLADVKKQANKFLGGFRAACLAVLNVASTDANAKKLCAWLGINAESTRTKNIDELRKNILDRLPLYYNVEGKSTDFPARLKKVNADQIAAGMKPGYIAVPDTYLNALCTLAGLLSAGNQYERRKVEITQSAAEKIADMNEENTICIVYDKNGENGENNAVAYIKYKQAQKQAADAAAAQKAAAYIEALK